MSSAYDPNGTNLPYSDYNQHVQAMMNGVDPSPPPESSGGGGSGPGCSCLAMTIALVSLVSMCFCGWIWPFAWMALMGENPQPIDEAGKMRRVVVPMQTADIPESSAPNPNSAAIAPAPATPVAISPLPQPTTEPPNAVGAAPTTSKLVKEPGQQPQGTFFNLPPLQPAPAGSGANPPVDLRKQAIEQAKWRMWTSADGAFQTRAKFISSINAVLTLEKEDGKRIRVSMEKLSDADQDFVRNQRWLEAM